VKVIVALRQDLLDRVLHSSHDVGFQEEKYESSYLELRWTKKQLTEVVEKRVDFLVKRRYSSSPVRCQDVFPGAMAEKPTFDYIFERTFMRPRDVILFINECINLAVDSEKLTESLILKAEEEYSYKRLQSLATEWVSVFPQLIWVLQFFSGFKPRFKVSDISEELVLGWFEKVSTEAEVDLSDQVMNQINNYYGKEGGSFNSVRNFMLRNLFMTGFLGIKTSPKSSTRWSTDTRLSLAPGQVKPNSDVQIHPMFHKALG
jgi:hypothetical protein